MVEAVLPVRRIPSRWLLPRLLPNSSSPMTPLALVITADSMSGWGWLLKKSCAMSKALCWFAVRVICLVWPLLKVIVTCIVAAVVFSRLIPVHQSAFDAMCEI